MIGTAVAIAETGGIGLAKGAPRAVDRGDHAVSRYGFGTTLAQLPAAFLAPLVERRFGAGSSQPLFLLAPFAAVLLAAAASGYAARLAGASASGTSLAVLLAGLGSPLAAYATSDYSEPLQAAALGGALALAFGAARETAPGASARLAAAAGFSAGFAVLLKSSLAAVAPILLLPLAAASFLRGRRLLAAALGSSVPLAAWLVLEIVRFGAPFSGYGGEGFTHPLLDGLWRLLVGPNRGLLLFFPACALAAVGISRALGRGSDAPRRLAAVASLAATAVLLATAASWWAFAYLVVVGSLIAFTAYVWVLDNAPLSLVMTYAYVNPVVAVALGALVLDEPITGGVLLGGAVVVVGVLLVVQAERLRSPSRAPAP